ncbi:tubulin binding cofactor A [Thelephora terrestris]|uniref:Tubulin-specific chaperone A n=1 Tax=Thelephora terrestris TaxID=56493 RepID=A0A9P6HGQ1_9AGAM|nr:tubulin binding cofactor A [Thelephora terrestris]
MADNKTATLRKQLKIKAGVVKRLAKEKKLYAQENQDLTVKLDKLVADNGDEWDTKNGRKLVEESERMIEDTKKRLGAAVHELRDLIVQSKADPALSDAPELLNAEEEVKTATL